MRCELNALTPALLASAFAIGTVGITSTALGNAAIPSSWEVASEFYDDSSAATACYGVWCYGYETALGNNATWVVFNTWISRDPPSCGGADDVVGWGPGPGNSLAIVHNKLDQFYTSCPTGVPVPYPAHALDFLPGNNCEWAVLRFTVPDVPKKGRFKISGQWYGLWDDNGGYENADVNILINDVSVYAGLIDMASGPKHVSFSSITKALHKGDRIDFAVGCGTNGNNYYDHVGLNAVIERLLP